MLGMRYLMDVISLDATLVKGSHGRPTERAEEGPCSSVLLRNYSTKVQWPPPT